MLPVGKSLLRYTALLVLAEYVAIDMVLFELCCVAMFLKEH